MLNAFFFLIVDLLSYHRNVSAGMIWVEAQYKKPDVECSVMALYFSAYKYLSQAASTLVYAWLLSGLWTGPDKRLHVEPCPVFYTFADHRVSSALLIHFIHESAEK